MIRRAKQGHTICGNGEVSYFSSLIINIASDRLKPPGKRDPLDTELAGRQHNVERADEQYGSASASFMLKGSATRTRIPSQRC